MVAHFTGGGAEVSWLGVVARQRLPGGVTTSGCAAGSPLTVAGAAPVSHRTSLSRRNPTLACRTRYRQRAKLGVPASAAGG
jgi:hypothetical protein